MAITHPCNHAKTALQSEFEIECEKAFPGHFKFNRSDLFHGDYQDELTRYTFAGYQLAKKPEAA